MPKEKAPDLGEIAVKHFRARELAKRHYGRADQYLEQLRAAGAQINVPIEMPGGKVARLVDLYEGKTKVYRAHGICRYELTIEDKVP
jgi:hypothetical protein